MRVGKRGKLVGKREKELIKKNSTGAVVRCLSGSGGLNHPPPFLVVQPLKQLAYQFINILKYPPINLNAGVLKNCLLVYSLLF